MLQVEDLKAKKDKLMTSARRIYLQRCMAAAQAQQEPQGAADAGSQNQEQQTMML